MHILSILISIGTILFGLVWASRLRKKQTKSVTIVLALATLTQHDHYIGLDEYSLFIIAAGSLLAGVEPSNSINLKPFQKAYFLIASLIFIILALASIISLPIPINKSYLAILYLSMSLCLLIHKSRKLRSRLGIVVIWAGIVTTWLI